MTPEKRDRVRYVCAEALDEYHSGYEKAYKNIPDLVDFIQELLAALEVAEREKDEALAQYDAGAGHVGAALDERDEARTQVATLDRERGGAEAEVVKAEARLEIAQSECKTAYDRIEWWKRRWGECEEENRKLRAQVETLAKALRYYAQSPNDGRTRLETVPMIDFEDDSAIAKAALKAVGVETKEGSMTSS